VTDSAVGVNSNIDWEAQYHLLDDWYVRPSFLEWKTSRDPFGPGYLHVELRDGVVAGTCCVSEREVLLDGEPVAAAQIGDTFTRNEFRRQGVFSRCVKACTERCLESNIDVIYGTPNDQSLPGYVSKLGFEIAAGARVRSLVRILHWSALGARFEARGSHIPRVVREHAARAVGRTVFGSRSAARPPGISVEVVGEADSVHAGDGLWGGSRGEFAFFTPRTGPYLEWRSLSGEVDQTVLAAFRHGECVGFAAFKLDLANGDASLVDVAVVRDDARVFAALMGSCEELLCQRGVTVVRAFCAQGSPYFALLRRGGFVPRRRFVDVVVFAATPRGRRLCAVSRPWHFMMSDSDGP
jgi:hypothetical protein